MCKELCRTETFDGIEEGSGKCVLEYYLVHTKHTFEGKNISFLCYGVEVRLRREMSESYDEIRAAEEIFASKEMAMTFLDKLADGLVTPCTLEDVIVDSLSTALSK